MHRRAATWVLFGAGLLVLVAWIAAPRLRCQGSATNDSRRGKAAGSASAKDRDRDGYPAWSGAGDPSRADCDDNDRTVTPRTERYIPAGKFWRGHPGMADTRPVSRVWISDLCMDVNEVTNQQYAKFLASSGPAEAARMYDFDDTDDTVPQRIRRARGTYEVTGGYERHPVVEVFPAGARAYCASKGKRLPTEAEWEKGARGDVDQRRYPWGDRALSCDLANFSRITYSKRPMPLKIEHCVGDTRPVGSYPLGRSYHGLMDMAGNVAELVADLYQAGYYRKAPGRDPKGPKTGFVRDEVNPGGMAALVTRGGSWAGEAEMTLVYDRHADPLDCTSNAVGFRCARPLAKKKAR